MKWIEFIRVRSSAEVVRQATPSLLAELDALTRSGDAAETFLMNHALFDGDLAVTLVWNSGVEPGKTREGLLLAAQLRQLGSVEHAVWIPASADHAAT